MSSNKLLNNNHTLKPIGVKKSLLKKLPGFNDFNDMRDVDATKERDNRNQNQNK